MVKRSFSKYRVKENGHEITEIDILAYTDDKAFIVEIKSSPDRVEYINYFKNKLRLIKEKNIVEQDKEIIPIYGGLALKEETIKRLKRENIHAIYVKGDILEIV